MSGGTENSARKEVDGQQRKLNVRCNKNIMIFRWFPNLPVFPRLLKDLDVQGRLRG